MAVVCVKGTERVVLLVAVTVPIVGATGTVQPACDDESKLWAPGTTCTKVKTRRAERIFATEPLKILLIIMRNSDSIDACGR